MKKYLLFFLLIGWNVYGQTNYNYIGADGGAWNEPSNWSTATIPLVGANTAANIHIPENTTVVIATSDLLTMISGSIYGSGTLVNNGSFSFQEGSSKYLLGNLKYINNGLIQLGNETAVAPPLYLGENTLVHNTVTGTIVSKGIGTGLYGVTGTTMLVNNGKIEKLGDFPVNLSAPFTNEASGRLDVLSGTLNLSGSSILKGGEYNVASSALLELKGNHTLSGNFSGEIQGELSLNSHNIFILEAQTVTNSTSGKGMTMRSGSIYGPGTLVNNSSFSFQDGSSKYLLGNLKYINNGLIQLGNETAVAPPLYLGENTLVHNTVTGTIVSKGIGTGLYGVTGTTMLVNNGKIEKLGDFPVNLSAPFTNEASGRLDVLSGTLNLSGSSILKGGEYNVASSALLELKGNHTLSGNFSGEIQGEFNLNSHNIFILEAQAVTNSTSGKGMTMRSGSIKGPGTFVNNSSFSFQDGSSKYLLGGLAFEKKGEIILGSDETSSITPLYIGELSVIHNKSTGIIQINSRGFSNYGADLSPFSLVNLGKIIKSKNFASPIDINTENSGIIEIMEGCLNFSKKFNNLTEGVVRGISASFSNSTLLTNQGEFNPGIDIGKMTINTFFEMEGGKLKFDIDGTVAETQYDVLEYNGSTVLNLTGDIEVNLGYATQIGDSFTVVKSPNANITANLPAFIDATYDNFSARFSVTVNLRSIVLTVTEITFCPFETIWDGVEWSNGEPNSATKAIIQGDLILSTDLESCSLELAVNGSLEISSEKTFTVNGAIINNAAETDFVVSNGGNLIQLTDAVNVGKITVLRTSQPIKRLDYTLWSSSVMGQELQAFSPQTLPNRIYTYETTVANETTGGSYVVVPTATADFEAAKGYLFRAPNNASATVSTPYQGKFVGIPFNGNTATAVHSSGYTSVGNPYPSNISADDFLSANANASALYFWNNTGIAGANYSTCTLGNCVAAAGGGVTPNGVITVGQGFLVETITGSTVSFDNDMRVADAGVFSKTSSEKHRIWLNLNNAENEGLNQILVSYMSGATDGIDQQIDGKLFTTEASALYNIIGEEKFVIQGKALPFENSDVIALGFKAVEAGNFNISLDNFDGLFADGNQIIYLKDNDLNVIHNLMEAAYYFESAAGEFNKRFEIVYEKEAMETTDLNANSVQIYTGNGQIFVSSKSEKILSVELFDLQGKNIHSNRSVNATTYQIHSASKGILVVKTRTQSGNVAIKKIINK